MAYYLIWVHPPNEIERMTREREGRTSEKFNGHWVKWGD